MALDLGNNPHDELSVEQWAGIRNGVASYRTVFMRGHPKERVAAHSSTISKLPAAPDPSHHVVFLRYANHMGQGLERVYLAIIVHMLSGQSYLVRTSLPAEVFLAATQQLFAKPDVEQVRISPGATATAPLVVEITP